MFKKTLDRMRKPLTMWRLTTCLLQTEPIEDTEDFMKNLLSEIENPDESNSKQKHYPTHEQSAVPVPTKRTLHPNTFASRNPTRVSHVPDVKQEEILEEIGDGVVEEPEMLSPVPTPKLDTSSGDFDIDKEMDMEEAIIDKDVDAMEEDVPLLKVKPLQTKARDLNAPSALVNATSRKQITRPPPPTAAAPAPPANGLQGWESVKMSETKNRDDTVVNAAPDKLNVLETDGSLRMWWFDAYERKEKGQVYLFGKALNKATNSYVSCCVTVKNIQRNIFVLPRPYKLDKDGQSTDQTVDHMDVYEEMETIRTRSRINKWACKEVTRKYAFEEQNVPPEAQYLKIKYSFEQPQLPLNLTGSTFSHVFGANTNPLELLLIKRDIMGPCWLEIKNPAIASVNETWCKVQVMIDDPKFCNPLQDANGNAPKEVPPLVIMSLSLRTVMNHQKQVNEIVAASAIVCKQVMIDEPTPIEKQAKANFNVVRQLNGVPYPAGLNDLLNRERQNGNAIHVEKTEHALLNLLIAKMHMFDPDVVVGHNFAGFDLDILLHRMKDLKTQHWHKLGRLKRSK